MTQPNCHDCVFAFWDPCQAIQGFASGLASRPACANHPESLGRMRPVTFGGACRNFRARPLTPEGDVKRIPLSDGLYAYVDAADYEWLSQWTWFTVNGYAARNEKGKTIYMHRQIMQPPPGKLVDHFSHNKLDNSRPNLRICTGPENQRNQRKKRGTYSQYKGVGYSKDRHKWYAQLKIQGKDIWLGYHATELEAARAYDRKAVELFGEFANLNFPEDWPPERRQEVYAAAKQERTKVQRKAPKPRTKADTHRNKPSPGRKTNRLPQRSQRPQRRRNR